MEAALQDMDVAVARHQLMERRERLQTVIADAPQPRPLAALLEEVDAALARLDHGTFGMCDVCQETVEVGRLRADPLVHTCLDCLSAAEQRALERDLDLAANVQRTLLPPSSFAFAGWQAAYAYQPAGSASGDFVDLLPLHSGELMFVVGDISGKGLAASLVMTHLHAIIRSLVALRLPFHEVLERANRIFYGSVGGSQYATLVCGKAGPDGVVEIANAGHCPPVVLRGSGSVALAPTSVPLGLFASAPFPTRAVTLDQFDTLAIYTDGVTEADDGQGREYGADRLVRALERGCREPVGPLASTALAGALAFRAAEARKDDATIFLLRREN